MSEPAIPAQRLSVPTGGKILNRRWLLAIPVLALVVVALIGSRLFGSSTEVASAHVGTGSVHVEIDMVKDGTGANDWQGQ